MDQQNRYLDDERRDRGGKLLNVLGVLTVIVVATLVVFAVVPDMRSLLPGPRAAAYPTQTLPDGISATSSQSAAPVDQADPFAGTAAAKYPKGAAGITLPPAKAVKGFTAKEVDAALKKVRAAMIAGRLDHAMLVDHKTAKFLGLLAPRSRKDIDGWFKKDEFSSIATWIAPTAKLDPKAQPRVSGRITYSSRVVDKIQTLQVTTNFVWVYAFTGADRPIVVAHDELRWEFPDPDNLYPEDRGMWLAESKSYSYGMDCTAIAKGMLAPGRPKIVGPTETTDPDALLRPDHTLEIGDDCP